ncbi:MAG TPA: zf-HC2 domain-containing protein [Thermoanaerobaculia bacterium]|nr:zf-HC2 domain-containing protein [Thermoanaerobaculia bacterium]
MLTCREVTAMIASDELPRRSWRDRLGVRLHLMMCRHCRRYAAQLAAIGRAVQRIYRGDESPPDSLERSVLDSLRKR